MSFFDFMTTENDRSPLSFNDLDANSEAEMMFQNEFKKNILFSRDFYQYASHDEIKMNEILLQDFFKSERLPIFALSNSPKNEKTPMHIQANSSFPSTVASNSENFPWEVLTPKPLLKKRKAYELESDFSVESEYIPEEEEELVSIKTPTARSTRRPHPKNSQDSSISPDSGFLSQDSQNKMKNHQGSIAGQIKKACKRDQRNTKLFDEATRDLSEEKKEKFREWASTYRKNQKTWSTLKKFLSSHKEFAVIFVKMITCFLSEDYKDEYEEWVSQSQMSAQTKALLQEKESKDFYILKFSLTIDEIQGKVCDFGYEIKKSRKFLKEL